jgi:hypothetical protein
LAASGILDVVAAPARLTCAAELLKTRTNRVVEVKGAASVAPENVTACSAIGGMLGAWILVPLTTGMPENSEIQSVAI